MIPLITAQTVAFWVFAPLAVAGALGMVLSRKPVHSALSLAGMMVALGCLYASLDAPFLFVAQIIVYTGAVMMLFIFTMMIVGVDSVDSLVETIRGQRVASMIAVGALAVLLIVALSQGFVTATQGLEGANTAHGGNVQGVAQYVFGRSSSPRVDRGAAAGRRTGSDHPGPRRAPEEAETHRIGCVAAPASTPNRARIPGHCPGPASTRANCRLPALLPDGSVAENSISPTLRVRGVAIVENDGLRSAHRAAITKFVAVGDEAAGTDLADEVAAELDDFGRPELPAGDADTQEQER